MSDACRAGPTAIPAAFCLAAVLLTSTASPAANHYTVRKGDTLSGIAASQLNDAGRWRELARINAIEPPYHITPGQSLLIPGLPGASPRAESTSDVPAAPAALWEQHIELEEPDLAVWLLRVGWFLFASGIMTALVGTVMFHIATFNTGVLWGLAYIMLPPIVGLIFLVRHWSEARKSFYAQLAGMTLIVVSLAIVVPYLAALMS